MIVSGDSDFSPLVSKLRENAKLVIGVGVKSSTSDLLMSNCDEFVFYDDLIKENSSKTARKRTRKKQNEAKSKTTPPLAKEQESEVSEGDRIDEGLELVVDTAEALLGERGDRVWGSMIKQTLKRRRPGFNERFYGFRTFGDLLEEAARRSMLAIELDARSGGYVVRSVGRK